jgi:O-antigen/teichoic acid export membrane protein
MTKAIKEPDSPKLVDGEKERLLPNASFAVLQVVVTSGILFLLYGYLLRQLGAEALGVWTLLMAATSLANISNLGITGGLVQFVSKHLARGEPVKAASSIQTAILTLAAVVGLVGLCMWGAIDWVLAWIIPPDWIAQARAILPYSILALWLSVLGGAVHSALEGCHRSDLRSVSTLLSQPVLLVGAFLLTPTLGLKGLALAQIAQYMVWIGAGWLLLRRQIAELPLAPHRWSKPLFLDMWRYGVNFQIVSILLILSEPLAKGLLSYYTNLSSVAYFEMANRLIVQIRSILVSANQVITPYYAKLHAVDSAKIGHIYLRNLQLMALAGSSLFAAIIASGPLVSRVWFGHLETQFLLFIGMLCLGWFINTLAVPAYFANLGLAHLGPNVRGHFAIMLGMVLVAVLMGPWLKPYGSAMAWPVGLMLGSYIIDRGLLNHIRLDRGHWARSLKLPYVLTNFAIGGCTAFASFKILQPERSCSLIAAAFCVAAAMALMALLNLRKIVALVRFNKPPLIEVRVP